MTFSLQCHFMVLTTDVTEKCQSIQCLFSTFFFLKKKKRNKSTINKISAKRHLDRAFSLNMWLLLMKFIAKSLGPQRSPQQSACQAHRRTQVGCPATTDCKSSWGSLQRTRHPDLQCYSPVLTHPWLQYLILEQGKLNIAISFQNILLVYCLHIWKHQQGSYLY